MVLGFCRSLTETSKTGWLDCTDPKAQFNCLQKKLQSPLCLGPLWWLGAVLAGLGIPARQAAVGPGIVENAKSRGGAG